MAPRGNDPLSFPAEEDALLRLAGVSLVAIHYQRHLPRFRKAFEVHLAVLGREECDGFHILTPFLHHYRRVRMVPTDDAFIRESLSLLLLQHLPRLVSEFQRNRVRP